jgi:anti-sigma factor RsiW
MDYEAQLKLQAHLDGELPEDEAREVTNWLARDREAVALYGELRNTRQALVGHEVGVSLPESREFFWSKIEREIRLLEPPETSVRPAPLLSAWRRWLVPAGAVAAVASALLVGVFGETRIATVETAVDDPAAFTYHDYSSRTTLVWFSYPADEDPVDRTPGTVE